MTSHRSGAAAHAIDLGASDREPLMERLCDRLPRLADALDADHAWDQARSWATASGPGRRTVQALSIGGLLYRHDGSVTLRYAVTSHPDNGSHSDTSTLLVGVPADGARITVSSFPHDRDLPTLAAATTPKVALAMLRRALPDVAGERGPGRCAVEVVHHPREGACVLRYHLMPGPGTGGEPGRAVYAKVYATGQGAAKAARGLRVLGRRLESPGGGKPVRLPRSLGVSPSLHAGLIEALPGRPLLPELLRQAGEGHREATRGRDAVEADLGAVVETAGHTLAALHRHQIHGEIPVHEVADEVSRLHHDLMLVKEVWPDVAARVGRHVRQALQAEGTPALPLVVSHGDYTPSQLLLHGDATSLIDLDTVCWAEPAFDTGRFLAYLDATWARRPGRSAASSSTWGQRFLQAYAGAGGVLGADPAAFRVRVQMYRSLTLARMALRSARQIKEHRLRISERLLEDGPATGHAGPAGPMPTPISDRHCEVRS